MRRLLFLLSLVYLWTVVGHAQVVGPGFVNYVTSAPSGTCSQGAAAQIVMGSGDIYTCQSGTWGKGGGSGGGTVTSIATTSPITGGTITATGTIACATCAVGPGASTAGHLATFASTNGITLADGGAVPAGTVTSVGLAGTAAQITVTGSTPITGSGSWTLSVPSTFTAPGSLAATTSVSGATYLSATKCAAAGTAASPSVAACAAAPSGSFSCATNASTATCTINTTAATAASAIFVQPDSSLSSLLSVTCNTTADSGLTAPRISARSAGVSFTITLGTFATNPVCFNYWVVN